MSEIDAAWLHFGDYGDIYNSKAFVDCQRVYRNKLKLKIDELITQSTENTKEHDRLVVMKVYLKYVDAERIAKAIWYIDEITTVVPLLDECLELLQPIMDLAKESELKMARVLHVYILVRNLKAWCLRLQDKNAAMEILKKNDELYESYIGKCPIAEFWDMNKVFGINDEIIEKQSVALKQHLIVHSFKWTIKETWFALARFYNFDNLDLCVKYGLLGLSVSCYDLMKSNSSSQLQILAVWINLSRTLSEQKRYKQCNFVLSVAIYYVSQLLEKLNNADPRSLWPFMALTDQIKEVSKMQVFFFYCRSLLVDTIARFSLYCLQNKASKKTKHLEEVMRQSNSEIIQENDLFNVGIQQYANEIPMELLKNVKQIETLANKALGWCYRRAALVDQDLNLPLEHLLQEVLHCISHETRILYPFCGDPQDPFYED